MDHTNHSYISQIKVIYYFNYGFIILFSMDLFSLFHQDNQS